MRGAVESATDVQREDRLRPRRSAALRLVPAFDQLHRSSLRRLLLVADIHAVLGGALLAALLTADPLGRFIPLALTAPLWVLAASAHGLYQADDRRLCHRTSDDVLPLFNWTLVCTALTLVAIPAVELIEGVVLGLGTFALAVGLRGSTRVGWRRAAPAERGLVIAGAPASRAIARKLELEPGNHFEVAHTLAPMLAPGDNADQRLLDRAARLMSLGRVGRVVAAAGDLPDATLQRLVDLCRAHDVKLTIIPQAPRALGTAARLDHLAELPLIEFSSWRPSRSTMAAKRAIDVVVAAVALTLLAGPMVLIAVVIRLDSKGPALYRQRRAGRGGSPFTICKFRTMVRDADDLLTQLVAIERLAEPMYKIRGDPRVTRVGRILRRTSLDEVPQLFNVLRGDMSLVGPRPEDVRLVDRYDASARVKLEVRPGMTGPMQVFGRGKLSFAERLAVEREYIENYSLLRDVKILVRTFTVVLHGDGAY